MKTKAHWPSASALILFAATSLLGQTSQPPVISVIPDQTVPLATQPSPILFTVWDPQNSPVTVVAASTDTNVVSSVQLDLLRTDISGTNTWILTPTPNGVMTGTATIQLVATDGVGLKATAVFTLIVGEDAFYNSSKISIPAGLPVDGTATPYPSVIHVDALNGVLDDVQVVLNGFSHPHPEDVDILLVSPNDAMALMLMAHAGLGAPASSLRLTFSGTAAGLIPQNGPLANQSYRPADYSSGIRFPSPAPLGPAAKDLSAFAGLSPNGDWKLYILDDTFPDGGTIDNGWTLVLHTRPLPVISPIGPHLMASGATIGPILFHVSSQVQPAPVLTVTATSDNQSVVSNANVLVTPVSGINLMNRTITLTANPNGTGTATITLTVSDGVASASTSFSLLVLNDAVPRSIANPAPIAINDLSAATPYPSEIEVSGYKGRISKLSVSVRGFSHPFPSDVGMLLVGPGGQKTVLMNNVGGGHPGCSQITLTFDATTSTALPINGPLLSGTYAPLDHNDGTRVFQTPVPAGPYTNTLGALLGTDPNGKWSLFVEDFSLGDFGAISNGWAVTFATEPVINGLNDVNGTANEPISENFTVGDDSPVTQTYEFSAVSDNQSVVTDHGIVFWNNGTNYNVTINPVPNAVGSANITVFLLDQFLNQVRATFKVAFHCDFPFLGLAPVPDQFISAGGLATIPFNIASDCLSVSALSLTFRSSNTNLIPLSNLKLIGANLVLWPAGNLTGTASITATLTSASGLSTNTDFLVTVVPAAIPSFANSKTIIINDISPATPYPSTIDVAGLAGNIKHVSATLLGMKHGFPSDISILLVGPRGQKVVLMSRAGGSVGLTNSWLRIDDVATNSLPQFALINDGVYKPTDYKSSDTFFSPAPLAPYGLALSALTGTDPNGTWSLYVQDDLAQQDGAITGGWLLQIETDINISPLAAQTTFENQSLIVPFIVSSANTSASNLLVMAMSTNESPPGLIESLTFNGSGAQRSLVITPKANWPSAVTNTDATCTIVVSVTDGILTNSTSFPLTVLFVDQPPTICGLSDQVTPANVPLTLQFTVGDVDTPAGDLVVSASVSSELLGTATVHGGAANHYSLSYRPTGTTGTNLVSIAASDGTLTNAATFLVVSTPAPALPPSLTINPAGNLLKIRFVGATPFARHLLQRSQDLNSWTDLTPVSADATGAGEFDLQLDGSTMAQFYRVRTGP